MKKILIVSHDAGAANILVSLLQKYKNNFNWFVYLDGPAKKIFKIKKNNYSSKVIKNNKDIKKLIQKIEPEILLTGTSWASSLEIDFINEAKKISLKTVSFLDHWKDYRFCFQYPGNWKKNLPDYIFVGDKWAYKLALKQRFPKKKLIKVENPYFEEVITEAKKYLKRFKKKGEINKILFVSQPISDFALKQYGNTKALGFTEFKVLKDLLKIISTNLELNLKLKIKIHPAEKKQKYEKILKTINKKIKSKVFVSDWNSKSLVEDLSWADIVIGSETMALAISFLIGKNTISYNPKAKRLCTLPQKGIKKISSFNGLIQEFSSFTKKQVKIRRKRL